MSDLIKEPRATNTQLDRGLAIDASCYRAKVCSPAFLSNSIVTIRALQSQTTLGFTLNGTKQS